MVTLAQPPRGTPLLARLLYAAAPVWLIAFAALTAVELPMVAWQTAARVRSAASQPLSVGVAFSVAFEFGFALLLTSPVWSPLLQSLWDSPTTVFDRESTPAGRALRAVVSPFLLPVVPLARALHYARKALHLTRWQIFDGVLRACAALGGGWAYRVDDRRRR